MGIILGCTGCERQTLESAESLAIVPTESFSRTAGDSLGWPCFQGPTHNSVAYESGLLDSFPPAGPQELWRREVGTGYSSPVVTDSGLIVFYREGDEEIIECLDPESGESQWKFPYPTAWVCEYEYSNGPYSTPVIDGEVVYAVGAEGKLHALRIDSGELVWRRDLKADYAPTKMLFCMGASPLIHGDRLFYTLGGSVGESGTICLDKRTGETLWTATDHEAGYATPVVAEIHGREYLFVFDHFGLVALDPTSGQVHWEIPFQSRSPDTVCATSPVIYQDLVMVTMGPAPGALCVRVLPDGGYEEVWRERRVIDSTWNNVVHYDGNLFGYTSKRIRSQLRSIDIRTGEVRWQWESDLERGSLIAADGKLIAFGEHGHLALLKANPYACEVLAMTVEPLLKTPCYPLPALFRGRLYLKNETTLVCYDFRHSPD
jgi:outer membrane protein assembly factor BamB